MAVKQISMEREYAKNPDIAPEDIKVFRDWLMTQPHLPGKDITDQDLMIAYHSCERRLSLAKKVLDLNYTLKTHHVYFKDRVVDEKIKSFFDIATISFLTEPSVEGYQVAYAVLTDSDPKKFDFNVATKAFMMAYDLWQYEVGTSAGFVMIIDMNKTQLAHLAKLEISSIRNLLHFVQDAMFIRLKSVYFINAPYFMDKLMLLLRPFLKKSLMDILKINPVGDRSLYEQVAETALPKEQDHKRLSKNLCERLESNREFFKEESKKRVQDSLRPGGKGTAADNYGIQGSFKKLDID